MDPRWRRAFELAWEAMRHGSYPVGAVVVDGTGHVVAGGRNRRAETSGPKGQVVDSVLAHAELNALVQLRPGPDYTDHEVWTTLEPCLLCSSALRLTHIGMVRYAASDGYWAGVDDIPQVLSPTAAGRWTARSGPETGLPRLLGGVLPAWWYLDRHPVDRVVELAVPSDVIEIAQQVRAAAPTTLDDAVAAVLGAGSTASDPKGAGASDNGLATG